MVLYFSGTGNTRYAAQGIASLIDDEAASMNEMIKARTHRRFYSKKPYVICAPIYAWRFPRIVESFIRKSDFWGSDKFYFIATCDSQTGNAAEYLHKICRDKNVRYCGFSSVAMPENYITMFDAPEEDETNKIISSANDEIRQLAKRILNGEQIFNTRKTPFSGFMTKIVNPAFYSIFVSDKQFYAADSCTTCGKCAKVCPLNNIMLKDGKPIWLKRCTHCMACISSCPVRAIEYGRHTVDKKRYLNDKSFPAE